MSFLKIFEEVGQVPTCSVPPVGCRTPICELAELVLKGLPSRLSRSCRPVCSRIAGAGELFVDEQEELIVEDDDTFVLMKPIAPMRQPAP